MTELEKRGLVVRKQSPQHGRIVQTFLTERGRTLATAVIADAISAHERVFGVLSPGEQAQLRALLARVVEQGTGNTMAVDHIDS